MARNLVIAACLTLALAAAAGAADKQIHPARLTARPGDGGGNCVPGTYTLRLGSGRAALMRVTKGGGSRAGKALILSFHGAEGSAGDGLWIFRGSGPVDEPGDVPRPIGRSGRLGSRGANPASRAHSILRVESLLLGWFAEHGRDLPWRRTRDPYAILVSEVMLQQTQVERVVPRYLVWLERWPTVESLAAAPAAAAIREWQGLGYNRRALNLHRAARHVAAHGWPDELTKLPGVGPYTAAAIRCFAFGENVLPVDVNVARILGRTKAAFTPASAQALMDLGATVCIARTPRCDSCPLADRCPSRGIRESPVRKQSPFEGSFRQRRAAALSQVAAGPRALGDLDDEAVRSLERDGLVVVEGVRVVLPGERA